MKRNSSNQQSKSVSEPVSVTDLGWKAAACCSSSAIRYSFLDVFSWMTGAFGLKFSLYCSGGFSWILFLFENNTMSHI